MCLFLRIAKVGEDFFTGRIMQVSTEMFLKSFFVVSQNTEAELFPSDPRRLEEKWGSFLPRALPPAPLVAGDTVGAPGGGP